MRLRWLSAIVGIPIYIGLCLAGSTPFAVGLLCVAAISLAELLRAYRSAGVRPNPVLASAGLLGPAAGLLPDRELWHGW